MVGTRKLLDGVKEGDLVTVRVLWTAPATLGFKWVLRQIRPTINYCSVKMNF